METSQERQLRLGRALEKFIREVHDNIEEEIPNWLNENPYWEIDGDDGRPERCPRTTAADAREDLCDSFVREGDDLGYSDFFEFVISEAFGVAMSKKNSYREPKPEEKKELQLTPYEETIRRTNQTMCNLIDDVFKGCFND